MKEAVLPEMEKKLRHCEVSDVKLEKFLNSSQVDDQLQPLCDPTSQVTGDWGEMSPNRTYLGIFLNQYSFKTLING